MVQLWAWDLVLLPQTGLAGAKAWSWIPRLDSPEPTAPVHLQCTPGLALKACSYVAEGVQVVVRQLQLLEGDQLPHPVGPSGRRIRVDVEPSWHGGLRLPRHHPANTAIGPERLVPWGLGSPEPLSLL